MRAFIHFVLPALVMGACSPVDPVDIDELMEGSDDETPGGSDDGPVDQPGSGSGSGSGGGDDTCRSSDQCGFTEICWPSTCTDALDRRYFVTIVSVRVDTTNSDGAAWDFGGGAPDPYVVFGPLNTAGDAYTDSCTTDTVSDEFSASWNEGCEFTLASGGAFGFDVVDEDLSDDDFILSVSEEGNDALMDLIKADGADLTYTNDVADLVIRVTPEF